ncbi:flagellar type III secretion system protein FliR [Marinobacterium sp. D7]|uniref:flagellar biosynthetic protein FliR n=1 Tax=Marinobacterium ramblicola TaxID=2849041 RepID=UPI001C2D3A64|nr:flagellar biosynthetic protein FliR [Marinobacterium ramblicola]MBV1789348.1 flagellar type III secretion system protein FliR [Marinobacterium ramblicola]
MQFDLAQIEGMVATVLLPLFRVASMLMTMPMIGTRLVPIRARLGLALAITAVLVPVVPPMPTYDGLSLRMWLLIAEQVLIGSVLGYTLNLLMETFALGGQMIANQMGLGFASMTDPANGTSVVVLGQFYLMMVMLMFLAMDGHLVVIEILAKSFEVLPVGQTPNLSSLWGLVLAGGWLFSAGLLMALPAVTALLVVNFAFGVMTKAAPQLNIFAIGFPFTMLLGIVIVWASLSGFLGQYESIASRILELISSLVQGAARSG